MSARCLITLEEIPDGETYSPAGLRRLHPRLRGLQPVAFSAGELIREASARAGKMSIQGIQPKLSAVLRVKEQKFDLVDTGGRFILKPCPPEWPEVPGNEALTMTLAAAAGIDVPDHGLVYARDRSLVYWVRRFDRAGRNRKLSLEDFAQLSGRDRETKYDSSMEQVAGVIERFATFPAVEKAKLARRVLFCFLTGNEDMHLKNFSLLTAGGKTALSPAYDLLNTSVVLKNPREEIALPLNGKKNKLTRNDLIDYFCAGRLAIAGPVLTQTLAALREALPRWRDLISRSFLSDEMRQAYLAILDERAGRIL